MGQAMFYHLTRNPLEVALAGLLDRAAARGMRVVVRGLDPERLMWLDEKLWLGPEEQFLPHGLAGGPHDADQPILLTAQSEVPNGATCVMAIEGAEVTADEVAAFERVCILFDGTDADRVNAARATWASYKAAGVKAQYWSEDSGRWEMKAET